MNQQPSKASLLSKEDRELLLRLREQEPAKTLLERPLTTGERAADFVASTVGSWKFIITQTVLLIAWIVINVTAWSKHWDPYPFILLNLMLSFQAAYTGPIVMMSQNRASEIDRKRAQQDLDCDLQAHLEIKLVHEKLNKFREVELLELRMKLERIEKLLLDAQENNSH